MPHTAQPITAGERTNLVLWLYGDEGRVPRDQWFDPAPIDPAERWTVPNADPDGYAPF